MARSANLDHKEWGLGLSLYADYLLERTGDKIVETDFGFATYRHLIDQKSTYIVDIYVIPKFRREKLASSLADHIAKEAKDMGHEKLLGSVVPSTNGSNESLKALLGYGMKLKSSSNDFIIFEKELN